MARFHHRAVNALLLTKEEKSGSSYETRGIFEGSLFSIGGGHATVQIQVYMETNVMCFFFLLKAMWPGFNEVKMLFNDVLPWVADWPRLWNSGGNAVWSVITEHPKSSHVQPFKSKSQTIFTIYRIVSLLFYSAHSDKWCHIWYKSTT